MGQVSLFPTPAPRKLEVHEHCVIRGPRANRSGPGWPVGQDSTIEHSHDGGNIPHSHPDTGPASYTIDKDEWLRATGMRGGGRKKFTPTPAGEQFEFIPRTAEERAFEVIACDPPAPPGFVGEGGGLSAAARMALAFGLRPIVKAAPPFNPSRKREA